MTDAATDLTPPTKTKAPKADKPKKEKVAKEVTAAAAPNGEKKPRAPRADYGFTPNSTIGIVTGKDHSYRGQRLEWFNRVKEFDGKAAEEFMKANDNRTTPKGTEDPPRGWLRFFVQDGTVALSKPVVAEQAQAA